MAKVFSKETLPHFDSTRDTRDRLDLVKDKLQVAKPGLWADRIVYHPGDTCANHYHKESHHLFVVLEGEGWLYTPEGGFRLKPGMVAAVRPDEVHWFENDTAENFKFVEFWAPHPQKQSGLSKTIYEPGKPRAELQPTIKKAVSCTKANREEEE